MNIEQYISLLEKQRRGGISVTDERALQTWLENMDGEKMAKEIDQINQLSNRYKSSFEPDVEAGLSRLQARMQAVKDAETKQLQVVARRRILQLAAVFLLAVVAVALIWFALPKSPEMLVITTGNGDQEQILLTDGSKIVLNENSEISFPKDFTQLRKRAVRLSGEAFFEVASNPAKPFVITTQETEVTVLGTAFNVRAYAQESITEVEVTEGSVQFAVLNSDAAIVIERSQKGIFDTNGNKLYTKTTPNLNAQAWRTNQLNFKNTPLSEVFESLERYYKVKIELANPTITRCGFYGNFADSPLSEVLESMTLALQLKMEKIAANRYKIYGQGCE